MNNLSSDDNNDKLKQFNSLRNGRRILPAFVDIEAPAEEQGKNQTITTDKNHKDCFRKPTTTTAIKTTTTTAGKDDAGYHLDCQNVKGVSAVLCLSGVCIGIVVGIIVLIRALSEWPEAMKSIADSDKPD